jgi:hypothetical protein
MMTTYTLQDGGIIAASCPADFVTKLRESSRFDSECTDQEYMYHFADRFHDQTGHAVRADTPEHFFEDLLSNGYISSNHNVK